MHHALYQIDILKNVFQSFCLKANNFNMGHFNIPKFYTFVYFKENIRLYKCINGYYTNANNKTKHHYIVKTFYNLTNKRDSLF